MTVWIIEENVVADAWRPDIGEVFYLASDAREGLVSFMARWPHFKRRDLRISKYELRRIEPKRKKRGRK